VIAEIGQFALLLALIIAAVQVVVPMVGAARVDATLMAFGSRMAVAQAVLLAAAFAALTYGFVVSDFSVAVVFQNSHSLKPMLYKVSGVWGNHEGSMLMWVLLLAFFGAAVAVFGRNLPPTLKARVLSVQAMIGGRLTAPASTRCCRTPVSPSIRRCSTSAMSASPWRFPSPSPP
jgi:cytochrome c-type biogenesis protein CcmF